MSICDCLFGKKNKIEYSIDSVQLKLLDYELQSSHTM